MEVKIFINYRRTDGGGYAKWLAGELRSVFPDGAVFFDVNSMESGADVSTGIRSSIEQCKVMLVLISHHWLEPADKSNPSGPIRLDDPKDYVRREIALALELGTHIIPILFDGAAVPPPERLPQDIRALSERINMHKIGLSEVEDRAQLAELIRLLAKRPGMPAPKARPQENRVPEPEQLAWLCDRSDQHKPVQNIMSAQLGPVESTRRPFVMVLHGPADEAHITFVKRLETYSLPRLFQLKRKSCNVKLLQVREALPIRGGQDHFNAELRSALANSVGVETLDSDEDLIAQVRANGVTVAIVVVTWRASEIAQDPAAALTRLFDYWARFPQPPESLLVGCVAVLKYDNVQEKGWLRRLLGGAADAGESVHDAVESTATSYQQDSRVAWHVLPKLEPVTVGHVDAWVTEVSELIGGSWYVPEETRKAVVGPEPCPMDKVLPRLQQLIPQV